MSTSITHKLVTAGLLSLCAAGLSIQAQTASPGPPSRNANVDKEDPNKPDTPEHEIPNQKDEAPGSGTNNDSGAAAQTTPSGGDTSTVTENRDPTQPIPRNSAEQNAAAAEQRQERIQENAEGKTDETQGQDSESDGETEQAQRDDGQDNSDTGQTQGNDGQSTGNTGQAQSDSTGSEQNNSNEEQDMTGQEQNKQQTPPVTPR